MTLAPYSLQLENGPKDGHPDRISSSKRVFFPFKARLHLLVRGLVQSLLTRLQLTRPRFPTRPKLAHERLQSLRRRWRGSGRRHPSSILATLAQHQTGAPTFKPQQQALLRTKGPHLKAPWRLSAYIVSQDAITRQYLNSTYAAMLREQELRVQILLRRGQRRGDFVDSCVFRQNVP